MSEKFTLPNMEYSFDIQETGKETGVNWVGKFKYKRPTLGARARIAVTYASLCGDMTNLGNDEVDDFNAILAHLRHTITESPDWWSDSFYGLDLYDGNIISSIYNKCMKFEEEWKEKIHGGNPKRVADEKDEITDKFLDAEKPQDI